jgi:hypothetical protein
MPRLSPIDRFRLACAVRATLDEWMAHGYAVDGAEINSGAAAGGCCSDFSAEVLSRLGDHAVADAMGLAELGLDNLQVADPDDTIGRPFDRPLLARHWPRIRPPGDLGWDDLDRLSEDAGFSGLTHVWLTMGGLHFDAEAPDGVENLFDLPFFRRVVASWIAERRPSPTMD